MKRIVVVGILIITMSLPASGQASGKKTARDGKLEQEVLQVDAERADAYVRGDAAALDRILADDCTYVHPNGKVETKAELLAGFKAQDRKYDSIKRDDVVVRIYGNTAVVTGRNTINAKYQGKDYSVQNRFTRIYVKQAGRWLLIAHQATNIAQQ